MIDVLKENGIFCQTVKGLYGKDTDITACAARYAALGAEHIKRFDVKSMRFFSSPGRIEICGNHTDHNHGKVLTAALTIDTLGAVTAADNGVVRIFSAGYPLIEVNLDSLDMVAAEKGTSTALVKGVASYFKSKGYKVGGFVCTTTSNVFKGAGVSSSSSFELLIAEVFNVLYNGGSIDAITKAKASQWAESAFFGKPCGLMDQSAIALGGVSFIDFNNPENPTVENLDWAYQGVSIILVNTGGDHCSLTSCYAAIREEMESVAGFFGKKVLREVDEKDFVAALPRLKDKFSGRAILRAIHFYDENRRVEKAFDAVKLGADDFFDYINASGESSYKLLQNCYPEGDTEQCIPLALELASQQEGVKAYRVHGGGFAGTIIIFARKEFTESIVKAMQTFYGDDNVFSVEVRDSGACDTGLRLEKTED